ncbi:MAG: hypothetical protein NZM44_01775 [Candidatus Calescibacterium sp.]|nr:hypothetical protein [Candidatus Calescibacterium sp.]
MFKVVASNNTNFVVLSNSKILPKYGKLIEKAFSKILNKKVKIDIKEGQ